MASEEETYFSDAKAYKAFAATTGWLAIGAQQVRLSPGNAVKAVLNKAGTAYCLTATNARGTNTGKAATVYLSSKGGLQPIGVTKCPAKNAF